MRNQAIENYIRYTAQGIKGALQKVRFLDNPIMFEIVSCNTTLELTPSIDHANKVLDFAEVGTKVYKVDMFRGIKTQVKVKHSRRH